MTSKYQKNDMDLLREGKNKCYLHFEESYKTLILTLCYQYQTWTLAKSHGRETTTCEMKCLCKTRRITRKDREIKT